ncbi:MAG: hypothetical protein AMXMBFR4_15900 [Candidatus Hydrogenedentota bacterium]
MRFTFRFCPKCGTALEERMVHGHVTPVCTGPTCGYIFWQNSKPCATLVLENDAGEILLCVRAIEPDKGKLDLPGGFLNFAEHPFDGARRECREELGVDIEIDCVLGFCVDYYGTSEVSTLVIAMLGRIANGTPVPADDVAALRWLKPQSIDISELAFTNNETIIFELYAKRKKQTGGLDAAPMHWPMGGT